MSKTGVWFGPFRFEPIQRTLWHHGQQIQIGARAAAILGELISAPGQVVAKTKLRESAWPGLNVADTNIKVQISAIRKALGSQGCLIKAEGSHGYIFTGKTVERTGAGSTISFNPSVPRLSVKPLGREKIIPRVIELLGSYRLVSIVGPGGIGKTTLATAIAEVLDRSSPNEVLFVDLGRVTEDAQVYAAITDALNFDLEGAPTIEQILLLFRNRRLLLILDCCEHLADAVAHLAEQLIAQSEHVRVLATTRESLRITSEYVYRLEPLEIPPAHLAAIRQVAVKYSAVQLFERTARQALASFRIKDTNATTIARVCAKLDGVPLAIEFAASMVGTLSLEEIDNGLDARFTLLDREWVANDRIAKLTKSGWIR